MTPSSRLHYSVVDFASTTWTINNFKDQTQRIESPPIISTSCECFFLYMNPEIFIGSELYVTVYLYCTLPRRIIFRVSILRSGEKRHIKEYHHQFTCTDFRYSGSFIKRAELLKKENHYLRNGNLTVCCEIEVIDTHPGPFCIPESSFAQNALLSSATKRRPPGDDITFLVGDKKLPAKKALLTERSSVFEALFKEEFSNGQVKISGVSANVFERLLQGIDTGTLPSLDEHPEELLAAAQKFQLGDLKKECEQYLISQISPRSVMALNVLASMHQANELKAKCAEFMSANWSAINEASLGSKKKS